MTGRTEEKIFLENNMSHFLVREKKIVGYNKFREIKVLDITQKAYKILFFRKDGTSYFKWIERNHFHTLYELIEKLIDGEDEKNICPKCSGTRFVVCPNCSGEGQILKEVHIYGNGKFFA